MATLLLSTLRVAHSLVCSPGTWASGASARTPTGAPCSPSLPYCQSYSLYGALVQASHRTGGGFIPAYNLCRKIAGPWPGREGLIPLQRWNDTHTQEEVLDLLNAAIDLAIRQQPVALEPVAMEDLNQRS